jgi:actin cytoskeleton-regulatory complex protein SLA1
MSIEKSKHVRIDVGDGLHFNAGSKETAEAIIAKLTSSKAIASGESSAVEDADAAPEEAQPSRPRGKSGASVHFSNDAPAIIPAPPPMDDDDEEEDEEAEGDEKRATALYDFEAAGADELSVREGEVLIILEATGDEWWKCRNETGQEGDVPASYLEVIYIPMAVWDGNSCILICTLSSWLHLHRKAVRQRLRKRKMIRRLPHRKLLAVKRKKGPNDKRSKLSKNKRGWRQKEESAPLNPRGSVLRRRENRQRRKRRKKKNLSCGRKRLNERRRRLESERHESEKPRGRRKKSRMCLFSFICGNIKWSSYDRSRSSSSGDASISKPRKHPYS